MKNKILITISILFILSLGVNIYAYKTYNDIANYDDSISANFFNFKDRFINRIDNLRNNLDSAVNNLRDTEAELERLGKINRELTDAYNKLRSSVVEIGQYTKESRELNQEAIEGNLSATERLRKLKERIENGD